MFWGNNYKKETELIILSNRFTEKSEKALNGAVALAQSLGHTYIGSEHILLSLAKEGNSGAVNILSRCGVNYDKLVSAVKEYSGIGSKTSLTPKDMTPRSRKIVENSYRISLRYGAMKIGTEHILLAILEEKECVAVKILGFAGADVISLTDELITVLRTAEKHFESPKTKKEGGDNALFQYGKNLTELARDNKLDPVIGREKETERLIRILCRKTKNNPCLIGEAGVGKTAIVEGLAQRIANGDVPLQIKGKSVVSVDLTSMVAGAKYRGDFEERIKNLINEAIKSKNVILFIDEIHTIVGAGSAEGAIDAANILKPQLSRAEIQLIGATTFSEYHKYIEKDAALERRFQALTVDEPTHAQTIDILKGLKAKYEEHHSVSITDEAIEAAVFLSERYIQDRFFPDKAIDVIDEACARANVVSNSNNHKTTKIEEKIEQIERKKADAVKEQNYSLALKLRDEELNYRQKLESFFSENEIFPTKVKVEINDVKEIINEMTGIPISGLTSKFNTDNLRINLKKKIYGQDTAIEALVSAVMRSEASITNPDRPKGVFLFIGGSGVGKTELAKALAEELFFTQKSLIRYDMSEFSEKNSVTMLIGSPPGYVGYEEGGALTEKIRRHPYSVVLFDEIEKAHPEVLNLFLQIMDYGALTDSCGRSTSFKNTYIIMTSNALGGGLGEKSMGFLSAENLYSNNKLYEVFSPEFINRIDSIIHFSSLEHNALVSIADKKLGELRKRISESGIEFEFTPNVCEFIANKTRDKKMGARSISRIIMENIENVISEFMLQGSVEKIHIDADENTIRAIPYFINENKYLFDSELNTEKA
jgi:ATP-dependent Clp protease ATP-binding subunit ClpC